MEGMLQKNIQLLMSSYVKLRSITNVCDYPGTLGLGLQPKLDSSSGRRCNYTLAGRAVHKYMLITSHQTLHARSPRSSEMQDVHEALKCKMFTKL